MKGKRGVGHTEIIIAISIFLAGIMIVFMLLKPGITKNVSSESQLANLEKSFSDFGIKMYKFYISESCDDNSCIKVNENPPIEVYCNNAEDIGTFINACELEENQYTIQAVENVYDINRLFTSDLKFNITIMQDGNIIRSYGKNVPRDVSVKAKEIAIKILNNNQIQDAKAILRVW